MSSLNATFDILDEVIAAKDDPQIVLIESIDSGLVQEIGATALSRLQFHSIQSFRLCLAQQLDNFTAHVVWPDDVQHYKEASM